MRRNVYISLFLITLVPGCMSLQRQFDTVCTKVALVDEALADNWDRLPKEVQTTVSESFLPVYDLCYTDSKKKVSK